MIVYDVWIGMYLGMYLHLFSSVSAPFKATPEDTLWERDWRMLSCISISALDSPVSI